MERLSINTDLRRPVLQRRNCLRTLNPRGDPATRESSQTGPHFIRNAGGLVNQDCLVVKTRNVAGLIVMFRTRVGTS